MDFTRVQTLLIILRWIIIGGVAGYAASLMLNAERQGCFINVAIGIAGALMGGFMFNLLLGDAAITGWAFLDTIIHGVVGSVVLLIILEIVLPGQQLGMRGKK